MSLDRRILYANNAKSTLAAGIGTTDLAFSSQPGEGLLFSNPSGAECFLVTFRDAFGNYEIMVISARSTDTFTVLTRGVDGTNARSWVAGAKIEQRATALILNQLVSQVGQSVFAVGGGTGNAITAAFDPPFTALINGMEVRVRAPAANTSAATFAIDGLAAKTIVKFNNSALVANDIVGVSHELLLRYSSTLDKFLLLNPNPFSVPVPITLGGTGQITANLARVALLAMGKIGLQSANVSSQPVTIDSTFCPLNMGSVLTGDQFLLIGWGQFTKGGTLGDSSMGFGPKSGTATGSYLGSSNQYARFPNHPASKSWGAFFATLYNVSGDGTLTFDINASSAGSDGTDGFFAQLAVKI